MAKYLYRYALESELEQEEITQNDEGLKWEDESDYIETVARHIAKANIDDWEIYEDDWRDVVYIWRDGDFENRKRVLIKEEIVLDFDAIELDKDDDPDDF